MSEDNIEQQIDDILEALRETSGKEVSRDELEKELKKFLEYGVPPDHAKQTLVKKFGGGYNQPLSSERILVVDLKPDQQSVHVLCRIISVNPREIQVKGEARRIFYGILGDESGTIQFTAWKDFELEKGTVVDISNAYTKEWQGSVKVNFGDRTKIKKMDASEVHEVNVVPREYKVKELRGGLSSVEVTARILEVKDREVEISGQKKKVFSGMLGDETGKAQFTAWYDFKLKEGAVVKISGGYVKAWKGIPQVTFDEKATVEKLDANMISKKDVKTQKIMLFELVDRNGALDVEVEGTVIEIRKGSGLVQRCPECNRVLQDGACAVHGAVEGKADVRMKLVIDDGTGAVSAILGKEVTEKLLGKTINDSLIDDGLVEEMNSMLFGHRISLQGNALGDQFGVTLIVRDAKRADFNITAEAERLSQELEELL
ncbi:Single-stranded DNA binding protein Ssb [uncultured archaeon]|nr:Single-stranded DNA binding protein Ssb [uncultured archaeon]